MRPIHYLAAVLSLALIPAAIPAQSVGQFESQSDVGVVTPPGTGVYDASTSTYTLASSGANLWAATDAFHFVWKKISGDVALTADVQLAPATDASSPHRKAILIFRQSLDPGSAYADAAIHGNGETALQYRSAQGDTTQDIAFNIGAPQRLRIEKRGDVFTLFLSKSGEPLHQVGASIRLHLEGPFYAGLGVCAHNTAAVEKATFSHVELTPLTTAAAPGPTALYSTLQTIAIDNNARMSFSILTGKGQMEAPNWTRDGKNLIFNRGGQMFSVPATEGSPTPTPTQIDTGNATGCTGSHGLSPDGKWLAITCTTPDHPGRRVYIVPSAGGPPRMVTANPDSYFHSWSPDGKTIAFTRPSHGSGNIFAVSTDGGPETALTTGSGISDDPDYSPDGQFIYFNSDRSGGMQIFRMHSDGSHVEQLTSDDRPNWTPHPSPDGKSVLILSYEKGTTGHPANRPVTLRILDPSTGKLRDLVQIMGGSGTDNVNNWAPDSAHFAFVSYQQLPDPETGLSQ